MTVPGTGPFRVHLSVFEGPFDLLLTLIGRRELDLTQVALAEVTDEFLAHTRALGGAWDLGQTTDFLVVAATLLDLKVARLLPQEAAAEEEDLALLEAQDLLFARLLQYRAYKEAAAVLAQLLRQEQRHVPREVGLDQRWASVLPEVELGVDTAGFAAVAARVLAPREEPRVQVDHVHAPRVDVREQMRLLMARLPMAAPVTFRSLVAGCDSLAVVVGRFLAVLELFREGLVAFDQACALADLHVRRLSAALPPSPDRSPGAPSGRRAGVRA